jgi:integrase
LCAWGDSDPNGGRLKPDTVRNILIREVITPLMPKFPDTADGGGVSTARLHSFRHYFCSTAADGGIPEQIIMKWLGHKDSRMVRHYYHLREPVSQTKMIGLNLLGSAAATLRQSGSASTEVPDTEHPTK